MSNLIAFTLACLLAIASWSIYPPSSLAALLKETPTLAKVTQMSDGTGSAFRLEKSSQDVMIAALPGLANLFAGQRPNNLGVKDGKLAPCPNSPNCVSSQAPDGDAEHKIAPLTYSNAAEAMTQLKQVIASMERTRIIEATDTYLYAEFETKLMGFVDDVEFYLDPTAQVIQVRSASRLGQSDLGVNRKRVEEIRQKFNAIASA